MAKSWGMTHVFYRPSKSRRNFERAKKKEKKTPKVGRPKPLFFRAQKIAKKHAKTQKNGKTRKNADFGPMRSKKTKTKKAKNGKNLS